VRELKLMNDSNAEAGIALICTCLPAFVAQCESDTGTYSINNVNSYVVNILKERAGYSSNRGTNGLSGTHKLSALKSGHLGTGRTKKYGEFETWSDEAELVTQVKSSMEREPAQPDGITRRVEVTHTVTYARDSGEGAKSAV
jgi:hypothetical protein